jgi:hypothetical protein
VGDKTSTVKITDRVTSYGQGNNCTLSYIRGSVRYSFRLRCIGISHGFTVLGDQSQARTHRAFYPRMVVPSQFSMTFALKARPNLIGHKTVVVKGKRVANVGEYEHFNAWMFDYMQFMLLENADEAATPTKLATMVVSCPARNFYREGVPLGPIEFGDHVGSMLWRQSITFETTKEPLDTDPNTSKFAPGFTAADKNAGYFYPKSHQLNGSDAPLIFDTVSIIEAVRSPVPTEVEDATLGTGTGAGPQ